MNTNTVECQFFNKYGCIIGTYEYQKDSDLLAQAAQSLKAIAPIARITESLFTVVAGQPTLKVWTETRLIPGISATEPDNVYGRARLLLTLLYCSGFLPEVSVYGKEQDDVDPDMLFINGEPAGKTDAEVTNFIWNMRKCYAENGYLFD